MDYSNCYYSRWRAVVQGILNMNRFRMGACALALMGTMITADMAKADEAQLPTPANWDGLYAGLFAGYGGGKSTWNFTGFGAQISPNFSGAHGGALAGYNHQLKHFILGIEGDIAVTDWSGNTTCPILTTYTCQVDFDWFTTIRGRAGVPVNNSLIYLTGGLAGAGVSAAAKLTSTGAIAATSDQTYWGWTAGGGVEMALRENIALRGEALYFDLGSQTYSGTVAGTPVSVNVDLTGYQVRAAVVFRFP
jgi:outer membrane immunogenic protein